jgi:hypothetical protein
MTEEFSTPAVNTLNNAVYQWHIVVDGELLASEGNTKIAERKRTISKRCYSPDVVFY